MTESFSFAPAQYPDLSGKRFFITGASSGIGAGMAVKLAQMGANLVLHYHQNPEGIERTLSQLPKGVRVTCLQADYRDLEGLHDHFLEAWAAHGGLDGLVNNAGVVTKSLSLHDLHGEKFNHTLAVNLQAPYLLSTYFAEACFTEKKGGVIVNNSSIHGSDTCEWFAAYAASKAGLEAMAKAQAIEWAEHGVRVNNIAPGVVPVERTQAILSQPKVEAKWMANMPTQRYGTVEDIAEATAFLLSDASAWTTGTTLTVDGGMTARGHYPKR